MQRIWTMMKKSKKGYAKGGMSKKGFAVGGKTELPDLNNDGEVTQADILM